MKIKDKRLFEILKEYITVYLPLQKKVSPNTVKSYKETLNLYLDYLCLEKKILLKDIHLQDLSYDNITTFLQWLECKRSCIATTINHHLSVIRAFLKYAGMKDPVYNDYYLSACQVTKRKAVKKLTVDHFSEATLKALLEQPDPKKHFGHRDLFYMILLYDTGARDREILDLRLCDVVTDINTPYIIIHGKGSKIRTIPIMQETVAHYQSYKKRFHGGSAGDSLVFYTTIHDEKQQMSDDNVARFIKKYASMARQECNEVPERVTPHMFRHSRALHLYRKGVPLPLISEWLGHSNLEATLIYAYADTEMKRLAIEKATDSNHPLRNKISLNVKELDDNTIKRLYGLK